MTVSKPLIYHFDTIDSTNDEARRLHEKGAGQQCWIIADEQTAGRGRRGRVWSSTQGNVAATLYLPQAMPAEHAGHLSFVMGLALHATLSDYTHAPVHLKWPNDTLIEGAKISGMLLEAFNITNGEVRGLAVGVGINIHSHPSDTPYPATHLGRHLKGSIDIDSVTPRRVLEVLATQFDAQLSTYQSKGFEYMRNMWLACAYGVGGGITVNLETTQMQGIFDGVDASGHLLLRHASGEVHKIAAGDVFFGSVKTDK